MRPQRLYCYNIIAELEKGPRTLRDLKSALGGVSYGGTSGCLESAEEPAPRCSSAYGLELA
jgi:hypothetical protein